LSHPSDVRIGFRSILSSRALTAGLVCVFLGAVDLTVIASILSTIIPDLGVNTADIDRYIWVVNGYLIAYVVAIPLVGRLSDLVGRQPAFFACLAIFAAGSILCGSAGTLDSLILGRTLQGLGGGGLLPVTIALAGDVLPRHLRLAGIGLVSAVDTLGWVIGPTWGAVVVGFLPSIDQAWRWVFWINLPLLAIAVIAVFRAFPRHERHLDVHARVLDIPGATLLAITLVSVNLALASGGEFGAQSGTGLRALGGTPNPLASRIPLLLAIGAVSLVALVLWERRSSHPILPVSLFRRIHYVAVVAANFLIGSALMVGMVNVPVIVALVSSPGNVTRDSALLLAPLTLGIAVFSLLSGPVATRIGVFRMTVVGVIITIAGYALLYALTNHTDIWRMIAGLAVTGIGIGLLLAPLSEVALDDAGESNRGSAVSTALMFRLLGMTIGMSLLTAAGVYRLQVLTGRLEPVVQQAQESTAEFLIRQQDFVEAHVIPLGVQVMQETFLAAAFLAALALAPIILMRNPDR